MVLTVNLSKASSDRVRIAAFSRSCTLRHILESAVWGFVREKNFAPYEISGASPRRCGYRTHFNRDVKITTTFSEECRSILIRLKAERGFPISHSLEMAVRWYLWESPDPSSTRQAFGQAFIPLIDAPIKEKWGLGVPAPDLYQIAPGSSVFLDASILMLAMDSSRLGYFASRSLQADAVVSDIKCGRTLGFITPFIIADLWKFLTKAFSGKEGQMKPNGPLPQQSASIDQIGRRLQAITDGALSIISTSAEDVRLALEIAQKIPIKAEIALSLASVERIAGRGFAVAAARPDFAPLAGAENLSLFAPTDIDRTVPSQGKPARKSLTTRPTPSN